MPRLTPDGSYDHSASCQQLPGYLTALTSYLVVLSTSTTQQCICAILSYAAGLHYPQTTHHLSPLLSFSQNHHHHHHHHPTQCTFNGLQLSFLFFSFPPSLSQCVFQQHARRPFSLCSAPASASTCMLRSPWRCRRISNTLRAGDLSPVQAPMTLPRRIHTALSFPRFTCPFSFFARLVPNAWHAPSNLGSSAKQLAICCLSLSARLSLDPSTELV